MSGFLSTQADRDAFARDLQKLIFDASMLGDSIERSMHGPPWTWHFELHSIAYEPEDSSTRIPDVAPIDAIVAAELGHATFPPYERGGYVPTHVTLNDKDGVVLIAWKLPKLTYGARPSVGPIPAEFLEKGLSALVRFS